MVFRSTFDPNEVAREREVIFEEANIETDNPKAAIIRQLYGIVFADNPYGYPVLGTRPTLSAATSAILKTYNKQYYTPENMTLVVAGPRRREDGARHGRSHLGRDPGHRLQARARADAAPARRPRARTVERPEQQARLALGWQAPPPTISPATRSIF